MSELKNVSIVKSLEKELQLTPELMLYTPKHTWAAITPEGNVRVGITEYASKCLNFVAHIKTEPVGKYIDKKEPFGIAETWMFMFDLYSPVSGKIVKINEKLEKEPQVVSEDPYKEGWIVEIKPENPVILEQELKSLFSLQEYKEYVSKLKPKKLSL